MVHLARVLLLLILTMAIKVEAVWGAELAFAEDFEQGLSRWEPLAEDAAQITVESGTGNSVLQLQPRADDFSHITAKMAPSNQVTLRGKFLFPSQGDGYLGFVYNYQRTAGRTDFGCIYVKSNGSYLRVSPHYDGNPSWRLHEDLRVDLVGDRAIQVGQWYPFKLKVMGQRAALFISDMDEPLIEFAGLIPAQGVVGFEARPGRGEMVWIDDVVIETGPILSAQPGSASSPLAPPIEASPKQASSLKWKALPARAVDPGAADQLPTLAEGSWTLVPVDQRGLVLTAMQTQYVSGDHHQLLLRTQFDAGKDPGRQWLAFSSANRIDVWLNGFYRGSVAPERFVWADHVRNPEHAGTRLPMDPQPGLNELVLRVFGDRFAGGGFYAQRVSDLVELQPSR